MKTPDQYHTDLQHDRITAVARIISQAYFDALDDQIPEKGDNRWVLGCRRYCWAREGIRKAVSSGEFPYLTILEDDGQKFTFRVGAVPVRFKRTDAENPDASVFQQYAAEVAQLSLCFFTDMEDPCHLSWRMLVEDDYDGEVSRVAFVGADKSGKVECFWEVPAEKLQPTIVVIKPDVDSGVKLEPAPVGLKVKVSVAKKA